MSSIMTAPAAGAGLAALSYAAYVAATWLRYGHRKRAREGQADALLDRFMPDYEVCEGHQIAVITPPDVTLAAAKEIELERSRVVHAIFRARELLLRAKVDRSSRPKGLFEAMKAIGWGVLAETPGEVVLGAVTRPWDANPVFRPLPPDAFAAFAEPGYVKFAWTLRADPGPRGDSIFRTETRAVATDPGSRRKFRVYWACLSPGIILIRAAMLRVLAEAAERRWRLEGDDIVPDAHAELTHATTIVR